MIREIKFRIRLGGYWHYWGFIPSLTGSDYFFSGLPQNNSDPVTMKEAMERSQQFTGLKDKNGKEIFEGDVVSEGMYSDGHLVFTVEITPLNLILVHKNGSRFLGVERDFERIEVIGNVFEHSHLLEGK